MADKADSKTDSAGVTEQEADHLLGSLKELADQWRVRLQDPAMRRLVALGKVRINPLVLKLLDIRVPLPPSGGDSKSKQLPPT